MKKKIVIASLMMASVLPFVGGIETVRADEAKDLSEKAKSDLDQAKEKLKAAQDEKAKLEIELDQAKKAAASKEEEKQADLDKLGKVEESIKNNEAILEKDQKIKDLEAKIKDLGLRMESAQKEAEEAQKLWNEAQENLRKEKENPSKGQDFASRDKVNKLKNEYEIAENYHGDIQQKEKKLKEELAEKEKEFHQAYGQKKSLEEFFEEFEKYNPEKAESLAYKEFKEKSLKEAKSTDQKYETIEKEIEKKNREILANKQDLAKSEAARDDKNNIYIKEKLALEYENNYKNKIIKDEDLDNLQKTKAKEVEDAYKGLQQCIEERDQAIKDYEEYLESEANKQRELEKSKSTAEWLRKSLADDTNDFAKENRAYLQNLITIHDQRKKAIVGELNKFADKKQSLKRRLEYIMNDQLVAAKQTYETKTNSLAALKEFREFLENKKNGQGNSQILKALEEKVAEAKKDLDSKLETMRELGKEEDKLNNERGDLGVLSQEEVQRAKEQIEKDKEEIARLKDHIKELEKSQQLGEVNKLENRIKDLDRKIKEIKDQINDLEKVKERKEQPRQNQNLGKVEEENNSDDYWIDLSNLSLEKIDEEILQNTSYRKIKQSLEQANEILELAKRYLKNISNLNKSRINGASYQQLRMNISRLKKILPILEKMIANDSFDHSEKIEFLNLLKELKTNLEILETYMKDLELLF